MHRGLTTERRRAAIDLLIVITVLALGSISVPVANPILRGGHGMSTALLAATYQFFLEGLAPLALIIAHREPLESFGLKRANVVRSLLLGVLLAIIYDAGLSLHAGAVLWIPLRRQPAVRMSLAAGFPLGLIGICVTVVTWGALEGFFGVYFWKKTSRVLAVSESGWLAPGVLAFALFNGAIHLIVGQGLEGFVTSFASGYAIAVIPALTGNAWGSLLLQTLTNAVGRP